MNFREEVDICVIIPLFNKQAYIHRSVLSVLNQTVSCKEILVIDDGSTDDSVNIAEACKDSRIKIVRQTNQGPGAARNRGLFESTSSLVAFLDADDEWCPEYLERCVTAMEQCPKCEVVVAGFYEGVEKNVKGVCLDIGQERNWKASSGMTAGDLKKLIDNFNPSMVVGQRDTFLNYGGFYDKKKCTYGEDTYLWLQVFMNHWICFVKEPLVWFHNEVNGLVKGHGTVPPLKPVITDHRQIEKSCPNHLRDLLRKCLAYYALTAAYDRIYAGRLRDGVWVLIRYGVLWRLPKEIPKLMLSISIQLKNMMRTIRIS